jgi:hypothetical protein
MNIRASAIYHSTNVALIFFGIFIFLTSNVTSAAGSIYYLSAAGADSNVGSPSSPWKTFNYAIPKLKPGDSLVIKDGIYDASNSGYPTIDCGSNASNGTASQPITVKAENERRALIATDGTVPALTVASCNYWRFEGLRLEGRDNSSRGASVVFWSATNNLTLRRSVVRFSNRYFNEHLFTLYQGSQSGHLIEENEFYSFHRHAIDGSPIANSIVRRNYCNKRGYNNISGGYPGGGGCLAIYPGAHNVVENNIFEATGIEINASGTTVNNRFYGNIVIGSMIWPNARGNTLDYMPRDTLLQDQVIVNSRSGGIYARSSKNTRIVNSTISTAGNSGVACDKPTDPVGDGSPSCYITNSLLLNNAGYGVISVNQADSLAEHTNAFNNSWGNFSVPKQSNNTQLNANVGSCIVFIPASSPMKGAGKGGADVGANVLYRYQNGVLTNQPLWNTTTGEFPGGAVVPGVTDISGSSRFDVHKRLNVNTNGCAFPAGYGSTVSSSLPQAPGNLSVVIP